MQASTLNPKVNFYFTKAEKWQVEQEELRIIMLTSGLTEELKWGVPCYTLAGSNIALIHAFQEYCAVLFHKGALLQDPNGVLIQQTQNTQGTRQMRFTNIQRIAEQAPTIKAYVEEAIELEKTGAKVRFKATAEYPVSDEFQQKLAESPALTTAFSTLTPGRQRAYLLYFSAPKQAKTWEARVEKSIPQILTGKGLND
ncbi:YdeI family protein [Hymenobacter glaciei]|uniref:YdeI family protein n=1 Tax=Hymenobacter glaciei TaxID=877209 RepID=A0ABP7T3L4_9BACT